MKLSLYMLLVPIAWCGCVLPVQAASPTPDFARYRSIGQRNMFVPLWQTAPAAAKDGTEGAGKAEQIRRAEELRKQAEAQRLSSQKKQIESSYSLTGIMFDGQHMVAFIQDKTNGNRTQTFKQDDMLGDCRVADIDDKNGKVTLDCQGVFQVILTLN